MTKIGIISDTHDSLDAIQKAVRKFNEIKAQVVIHCGDWCAPFALAKFAKLSSERKYGVYGNVDGERELLYKRGREIGVEILGDFGELEIDNLKIAVIHGKDERLVTALVKSGDYSVVMRGHTHKPSVARAGGTIIVNPGEACGYLTGRRTIAVLDTDTMRVEVLDL